MKRIEETLALLRGAAAESDSVLVAYSTGKDAKATLDLCSRAFKRVELFYLYLVPGLRHIEEGLAEAEARYKLPKTHQIPHPQLREALVNGTFCPNHWKTDDLPKWKQHDAYTLARAESGISTIATGMKRSDSINRRSFLGMTMTDLYPLVGWTNLDVVAYLKLRNLPVPVTSHQVSTGVTLSPENLCWLHDTYPDDFERIEAVFPYVRAAVLHRDWYGVMTNSAGKQSKVH